MPNEALKIADVPFMVTSQIQRAPHWTMIRELTMNAIEAAEKATGDKIVHWTVGNYKGVRKAVIWNTGPGMTDAELKAATDLACELDKNLDIDANFGVGAKVSSLPNNQLGMRWRSCKGGRVSEVIIGYDPEIKLFARFERTLPDGTRATIIDVTAIAAKEGRDTNAEWTEVMLLGNKENQDTAAHLIAALPTIEKAYVANGLYRRFYRLPEGVKIRLDDCYHRFDNTRNFTPVGQRYDKFARADTVEVEDLGLKIHFLHDPNVGDRSGLRMSSRGALGSTTTTCALIHKNEMYSVIHGQEWSSAAPHFGIPFGSKELCVHIELNEDDARPTQYRERLISKQTGTDIVPQDFAFVVRDVMPEWVKDVIRNASPHRPEDYSDLRRELQELLNKYKVMVKARKLDPTSEEVSSDKEGEDFGGGSGRGSGGNGMGGGSRRRFHEAPEGATTASLYEIYEKPPQIVMLDKMEDVVEKGLRARAASFIVETGVLFVNGLYEAVDRTVEELEPEFAGQADAETVRRLLIEGARRALAYRVGKATVFALAKRVNDDWTETDMSAALTKESLSIAGDDYAESLPSVRKHIRDGMKIERAAAA